MLSRGMQPEKRSGGEGPLGRMNYGSSEIPDKHGAMCFFSNWTLPTWHIRLQREMAGEIFLKKQQKCGRLFSILVWSIAEGLFVIGDSVPEHCSGCILHVNDMESIAVKTLLDKPVHLSIPFEITIYPLEYLRIQSIRRFHRDLEGLGFSNIVRSPVEPAYHFLGILVV